MFLTAGGGAYEVRWKALTPEPFQAMAVFIEFPLFQRAMEEVFGDQSAQARLRDVSAFTDPVLDFLMEQLRGELVRRKASSMYVQAIAEAVAIHLARHYAEIVGESKSGSPSLPGYKLRQVTDWMGENLAEEFSLERLAALAGLSKFYFNRLFKSPPAASKAEPQGA
jgi:AraC family transcriptional regulator